MKRILKLKKCWCLLLAVTLCFIMTGCYAGKSVETKDYEDNTASSDNKTANGNNSNSEDNDSMEFSDDELFNGLHHVEITVKDYGVISMELDADVAPITVTNFINLAADGFYDGLTFHRIIDGFMAQGGDPNGDGTGGSGKNIKGEFAENGVENAISHTRGTVSMARSSMGNDTASSQFFIVQSDSVFLDGKYASFGKVTSGMDVVDSMCKAVTPLDNNGTISDDEKPIISKITVID